MTHPNLAPTNGALAVVKEAKNASSRLNRKGANWEALGSWKVHGLNGHRRRKVLRFNVTFGGWTMYFFLTSGGVLMQETSDGLVPVCLHAFRDTQQGTIVNALAQL